MSECKTHRIFPVRYALSSAQNGAGKPLLEQPGFLPKLMEYVYTLRVMRDGFLHICDESGSNRIIVGITDGKFNAHADTSGHAVSNFVESAERYLRVDSDYDVVYVAYAEFAWPDDLWEKILPEKEKRMQKVDFKNYSGNKRISHIDSLTELVEEFRPEPGWLCSLRGFPDLVKIFDTEEEYHAPKLPQNPNDTRREFNARWEESAVPMKDVHWHNPTEAKEILDDIKSCGESHLIIHMLDPLGLVQEMASMHAAAVQSLNHRDVWHSYGIEMSARAEQLIARNAKVKHAMAGYKEYNIAYADGYHEYPPIIIPPHRDKLLKRLETEESPIIGGMEVIAGMWMKLLDHQYEAPECLTIEGLLQEFDWKGSQSTDSYWELLKAREKCFAALHRSMGEYVGGDYIRDLYFTSPASETPLPQTDLRGIFEGVVRGIGSHSEDEDGPLPESHDTILLVTSLNKVLSKFINDSFPAIDSLMKEAAAAQAAAAGKPVEPASETEPAPVEVFKTAEQKQNYLIFQRFLNLCAARLGASKDDLADEAEEKGSGENKNKPLTTGVLEKLSDYMHETAMSGTKMPRIDSEGDEVLKYVRDFFADKNNVMNVAGSVFDTESALLERWATMFDKYGYKPNYFMRAFGDAAIIRNSLFSIGLEFTVRATLMFAMVGCLTMFKDDPDSTNQPSNMERASSFFNFIAIGMHINGVQSAMDNYLLRTLFRHPSGLFDKLWKRGWITVNTIEGGGLTARRLAGAIAGAPTSLARIVDTFDYISKDDYDAAAVSMFVGVPAAVLVCFFQWYLVVPGLFLTALYCFLINETKDTPEEAWTKHCLWGEWYRGCAKNGNSDPKTRRLDVFNKHWEKRVQEMMTEYSISEVAADEREPGRTFRHQNVIPELPVLSGSHEYPKFSYKNRFTEFDDAVFDEIRQEIKIYDNAFNPPQMHVIREEAFTYFGLYAPRYVPRKTYPEVGVTMWIHPVSNKPVPPLNQHTGFQPKELFLYDKNSITHFGATYEFIIDNAALDRYIKEAHAQRDNEFRQKLDRAFELKKQGHSWSDVRHVFPLTDLLQERLERALDHPEYEQRMKDEVLKMAGINSITSTRAYFQIMAFLRLDNEEQTYMFPECYRRPIPEMSRYAKKLPYVVFDTGPDAHLVYPSRKSTEIRERIAELIRTNKDLARLPFTTKLT